MGAAFVGLAVLLALFAVGFLLATVTAALATVLPAWLALLLVGGFLLLAAGLAAALGAALLRRGTPPVPEQAIEEARLTGDALRGNGRG